MKEIRLGCSGWDYRDWEGTFYHQKDRSKLKTYSELFNTTEINSTFYNYPTSGLVYGWARNTPPDFKFSVKLNRLVTHEKMLKIDKDIKSDVERFCSLMKPLYESEKLACILIQLPPRLEFDPDIFESFLEILPREYRYALEFRNKTWINRGIEARKIMKKFNVASVILDSPLLPVDTTLTSDFAYVRWHGRGKKVWYNYRYSKEELKSWKPRIKELSEKVEVFGYFNNHYHGYAPENCMEILEMLGIATNDQITSMKRMEVSRKTPEKHTRTVTLDDFLTEGTIEELLGECMDAVRFEKAKKVKDIEILKSGDNIVLADVRGYSIYIDKEKRFILHDCPDWRRTLQERKFCKHIGSLMLALDESNARIILRLARNHEFEYRSYTGHG